MKREQDEGSVISSGSGDRAPEVLQIPDAYANSVSTTAGCLLIVGGRLAQRWMCCVVGLGLG